MRFASTPLRTCALLLVAALVLSLQLAAGAKVPSCPDTSFPTGGGASITLTKSLDKTQQAVECAPGYYVEGTRARSATVTCNADAKCGNKCPWSEAPACVPARSFLTVVFEETCTFLKLTLKRK